MNSNSFLDIISLTGYAIEALGVVIIVLGIGNATQRYVRRALSTQPKDSYHQFRREMGRGMLVGLEFLVAGDIIRTVVVIDSITDVLSLGLVVLIRTVLVFTIHLEVEGHWPWQAARPIRDDENK
jgi:uncharacterized membrane protein